MRPTGRTSLGGELAQPSNVRARTKLTYRSSQPGMRLPAADAQVSVARDGPCAYAPDWLVNTQASGKHVAALLFEINTSNFQS